MHEDILKKVLLKRNFLTEEQFRQGLVESERRDIDPLVYFANVATVNQRIFFNDIADEFGVEYVDLKTTGAPKEIASLLPQGLVQTRKVVAFGYDKKKNVVKLATSDPDDIETVSFIEKKLGAKAEIFFTDPESISVVSRLYHKTLEEQFKELVVEASQEVPSNLERLAELAEHLPMMKIVDVLLDYAIYLQASDIHIEPTERDVIIRFRIDGMLRDIMTFPKNLHPAVVARIKVLAKLKLDEHRLPQDGRFRIETSSYRMAFRVSSFPTIDGEKLVMRLLDESSRPLTLEQLGFLSYHKPIVEQNIKKPHGIIFVTGPTGSGKTTTLYTILNLLNSPSINISTIEDPIEYRMPRVNQAQVNPKIGFTFAAGLRSLLRQDPNVIMVGEIRDQETAEIAAHAALTGHLVLTSLHTNDAVGAPLRLSEMGVPVYLVSATTNIIIAQRLVRKICPNCIYSYTLSDEDLNVIRAQIDPQEVIHALQKGGELEEPVELKTIRFFKGKGCVRCGQSGYKGRVGIYEILENSQPVAELIFNKAKRADLLAEAEKQGMISMVQDGFIKAKKGLTSLEEVLRVTKE